MGLNFLKGRRSVTKAFSFQPTRCYFVCFIFKMVDKELKILIKELNKLGLSTIACCSGHNVTEAYIAIKSSKLEEISQDKDMTILRWQIPFKVSTKRKNESTNLWKINKKFIYKETKDSIFVEIKKPDF